MIVVDGRERGLDEVVKAVRLSDRLNDHGANHVLEADERGLISGRAWGMLAEPSAHFENESIARDAGCAYEQIINQKADGRFFDPGTGYTLLSLQIKHSCKGTFLTSADAGTNNAKQPYNVRDATHFQFRESIGSCRSVFVELRAFPLGLDGSLTQKTCRVDHDKSEVMVVRRRKAALTRDQLVELLKTRSFFARRVR